MISAHDSALWVVLLLVPVCRRRGEDALGLLTHSCL
jgi:hypothetical protein